MLIKYIFITFFVIFFMGGFNTTTFFKAFLEMAFNVSPANNNSNIISESSKRNLDKELSKMEPAKSTVCG